MKHRKFEAPPAMVFVAGLLGELHPFLKDPKAIEQSPDMFFEQY
jgi:hypothetical protein